MGVKPGYQLTEIGVIPEDWILSHIGEISSKVGSGITPTGGRSRYIEFGRAFIRSQNVGWGCLLLDDLAYIDDNTHSNFSSTELELFDVLLNITGASIGRCALSDIRVVFGNVNQHVCIIRCKTDILLPAFLMLTLLSITGQSQILGFQAGGNRQGLNFHQIRSMLIPHPTSVIEQAKIVNKIFDIDSLITSLEKLIVKKKNIKQGVMQELLTGKRRLPGFTGEWETKKLDQILSYERPDNYFFDNTEYADTGAVPVLTANKSFVLGYTNETEGICQNIPAIIFDDFTTDCKYVDFAFKVKSSAIKILRPKDTEDVLWLIYHFMQMINFPLGDHKRYYLSEYRYIEVKLPSSLEQQALSRYLESMDTEIKALEKQLIKYQLLKQGMMQELLTGRIRLV